MADINLTGPQWDFVNAAEQFPAMVAGFGAGKSHAAIWRAIRLKLQYPTLSVAYYLPTYDLVARMGLPRMEEALQQVGVAFVTNKNDSIIDIGPFGQFIFRTMDNPARIVAYEVADSICDELDTLATEKAREVWTKVIARNRQKKPDGAINTVAVATTPEGFRFVYDQWEKRGGEGYRLIRASTYSNAANLPAGYIDSLKATYSSAQLAAYLDGQFVNLASGSVYPEFDRKLNATSETMNPGEPLHIGMDFNVGNMSAVAIVLRNGEPRAVDELKGVRDTPAMIDITMQAAPQPRASTPACPISRCYGPPISPFWHRTRIRPLKTGCLRSIR
jgi:phage terminase large subunit